MFTLLAKEPDFYNINQVRNENEIVRLMTVTNLWLLFTFAWGSGGFADKSSLAFATMTSG